jgi:Glycosyltransferase like family 2
MNSNHFPIAGVAAAGVAAADVAAIVTAMTDGEQSFLGETLKAVLADTRIGQVVLCIEQGNTWIDSILQESIFRDRRLEILRLPMGRPGATRNQAIRHVRLPWVAYCDGDDVWCPGKIQIQRAALDASGSDFIGADHYLTDEAGTIRAFAFANYIPMPSSWLVRTQLMQQHGFDESLAQGSDGEWWVRTAGLIRKQRCPEMLLRYRVRSGSVSSSTRSKQRKAKIVALGAIPFVQLVLLIITWVIWRGTRQPQYNWLKTWDAEYSGAAFMASSSG